MRLRVSHSSWVAACEMMRREKFRHKSYLQWWPFSLLSNEEWEALESEAYYSRYIAEGSFVLSETMRFVTKGLVQKSGHSFRDSPLVSPVIFLYLLAFAVEYGAFFSPQFSNVATFYSGDIERRWAHYGKSYRAFCQALKVCSTEYRWCLKTDLAHFFESINIDYFMTDLQKLANESIPIADTQFIRALILYCGNGKFPAIQNHAALSYFATAIYLNDIDERLSERLRKMPQIEGYRLVRFVDDLYIFFDSAEEIAFSVGNEIAGVYADILRDKDLMINALKTKLIRAEDAAKTTAEVSVVDFDGTDPEEQLPDGSQKISLLFGAITSLIASGSYSDASLDNALFKSEDVSMDAKTIFRHYLYRVPDSFKNVAVLSSASSAVAKGKVALSFQTSSIVTAILNTRDERLIKSMLNNLFRSSRNSSWTSVDSLIAITYLLNRGMNHEDLLYHLQLHEPGIYSYIASFCLKSFVSNQLSAVEGNVIETLAGDKDSKIQYAFYLYHDSVGNIFESASYYRSFFDRLTSLFAFSKGRKRKKMMFKEKEIKKYYSDIEGSDSIIRRAESLRQENPLVHASAEMLRNDSSREELVDMIESLRWLISKRFER